MVATITTNAGLPRGGRFGGAWLAGIVGTFSSMPFYVYGQDRPGALAELIPLAEHHLADVFGASAWRRADLASLLPRPELSLSR